MTIREFQDYLIRGKRYLAFFIAVCVLLCTIYIEFSQKYTAEIYIHYLGTQPQEGMAHNGSELKPYEIAGSTVVAAAAEQLGIPNKNLDNLRKNISVSAVISTAEAEKYSSWIENFASYEETEEKKIHPVFYSVKFTTKKSPDFAVEMLRALVEQYRLYYSENYTGISSVTGLSEDVTASFDYFETANILNDKINSNVSYLQNIAASDLDYRSPSTGLSMTDLANKYKSLRDTRLAAVSRNILENGYTKAADIMTSTLLNRADTNVLESERNLASAATQLELMQVYAQKNYDYLWDISSVDNEGSQVREDTERDHYYSTEKTTYDTMLLDYVGYASASRGFLIDNQYNEAYALYFNGGNKVNTEIEQELKSIADEFNQIQVLANQTMDDYNAYKSAHYIAFISGITATHTTPTTLYYAISILLPFFFGILVILFNELKRKNII